MKSAYELAMERLRADAPAERPISDAQKRELAALDAKFKAKLAEREIFLQGEIAKATAARQADAVAQLREQLARERARLDEERDEAKDAVRARLD